MASRLIRESAGQYHTEDGKLRVELNTDYETECMDPHPVRLRVDALSEREIETAMSYYGARRYTKRTKEGFIEYIAYQCPGCELHYYSRWIIWDVDLDDYAFNTGPAGFDTKKGAHQTLDFYLEKLEEQKPTTADFARVSFGRQFS